MNLRPSLTRKLSMWVLIGAFPVCPANQDVAHHVSRLHADTPGILKKSRRDNSKDKPADVRQVSYSTGLHRGHGASIQQLQQKPHANQKRRNALLVRRGKFISNPPQSRNRRVLL